MTMKIWLCLLAKLIYHLSSKWSTIVKCGMIMQNFNQFGWQLVSWWSRNQHIYTWFRMIKVWAKRAYHPTTGWQPGSQNITRPDTQQDSRGRLGRSSNAKTACHSEMWRTGGWTDRPTDQTTDMARCSVACPRLRNDMTKILGQFGWNCMREKKTTGNQSYEIVLAL